MHTKSDSYELEILGSGDRAPWRGLWATPLARSNGQSLWLGATPQNINKFLYRVWLQPCIFPSKLTWWHHDDVCVGYVWYLPILAPNLHAIINNYISLLYKNMFFVPEKGLQTYTWNMFINIFSLSQEHIKQCTISLPIRIRPVIWIGSFLDYPTSEFVYPGKKDELYISESVWKHDPWIYQSLYLLLFLIP